VIRDGLLAAIVVFALASPAQAQTLGYDWLSSTDPPTSHVNPRRIWQPETGAIVSGVLVLIGSYGGSVALGLGVQGSTFAGSAQCTSGYADAHLVPIVGPVIGLGHALACGGGPADPVGLVAMDLVVAIPQLGGLVALLVGLIAGEDLVVHDGALELAIAPFGSTGTGGLAIGGTF
jgi:hypothetical protein